MPNRVKIIGLIVAGMALSAAAGFGSFVYIRALEGELTAARNSLAALGETVRLPVPRVAVTRGALLQHTDFTEISLPVSGLPGNVLRDLPRASPEAPLLALSDMAAGELVLQGGLAAAGERPNTGLIVSTGARAFAVAPRNLQDFIGLLVEGSSVDLVWTRNIGGGQTETRLIGSALRVLALPSDWSAPPFASSAEGVAPLAGKLLLEGAGMEAVLAQMAEQTGFFHILLSDGRRVVVDNEVVIGSTELESLPLVVRDSGPLAAGAAPADSGAGVISKITGASGRKVCTTAVVRGGGRVTMEVPC
ncbi:hypothetical protein Q9295_03160 [Xinfangfangia sp. CPCC 101601]|uniref:Flp pilus assembly protein CpaB n=1 Tax=Pseudogemmobacter lacusdianii TaxID=3069608 RepID=A0ABU0VUF7_9RHOB|nr:hypothetical protein [Xinfangfangia sp. CPCC 101601]MDQ2065361.1 hypothetical protein [Xinfangfangia sp. CPCC 101601]